MMDLFQEKRFFLFLKLAVVFYPIAFVGKHTFVGYCLQIMIPLSLYVTIELIKIGQVYFIHHDRQLFDPVTNSKGVECRALNITEDLGQASGDCSGCTYHILSVKQLYVINDLNIFVSAILINVFL